MAVIAKPVPQTYGVERWGEGYFGINAAGHARHHDGTRSSELFSQQMCDLAPVRGRFSRSDNRHRHSVIQNPAYEETEGRVGHAGEERGVVALARNHPAPARRQICPRRAVAWPIGERRWT